ncbi:hypothetical protein AB0A98_06155 [Streptomyces chrestomyceticus]
MADEGGPVKLGDTGAYGAELARELAAAGVTVVDATVRTLIAGRGG